MKIEKLKALEAKAVSHAWTDNDEIFAFWNAVRPVASELLAVAEAAKRKRDIEKQRDHDEQEHAAAGLTFGVGELVSAERDLDAALARQQKADAALRRVIDGMDDGELRALIAEGVAKAPHLAGVGGILAGRLEASRAAMKGTLTPGVVMAHQHLRMLAKHAVGLVEVVAMAGQPAGENA